MGQDRTRSGTASGVIAIVLFVVGASLTMEIMAPRDERLLPSLSKVGIFGPIMAAVGLGLGLRRLKFGRQRRGSILTMIGATMGVGGVALIVAAGVMIGWSAEALGMIGTIVTTFLILPGVIMFLCGNLAPKSDPDSDHQSKQ